MMEEQRKNILREKYLRLHGSPVNQGQDKTENNNKKKNQMINEDSLTQEEHLDCRTVIMITIDKVIEQVEEKVSQMIEDAKVFSERLPISNTKETIINNIVVTLNIKFDLNNTGKGYLIIVEVFEIILNKTATLKITDSDLDIMFQNILSSPACHSDKQEKDNQKDFLNTRWHKFTVSQLSNMIEKNLYVFLHRTSSTIILSYEGRPPPMIPSYNKTKTNFK